MTEVEDGVWDVDIYTQLIHDESEDGGFYFERFVKEEGGVTGTFLVSKLFPTKRAATSAWTRKEVDWEGESGMSGKG